MSKSSNNRGTIVRREITDNNFLKEQKKVAALKEWKRFILSSKKLCSVSNRSPFDWRFNAIHWAFDVEKLCDEIVYSLCWMNAYAGFYKSKITAGTQPSHTNSHVSYFAGNSVTRIDSCRDKIALMVWAYYYPFNPEEQVFSYENILKKLRVGAPVKFGSIDLKLRKTKLFLKYLDLLTGDKFKRIEEYRHLKIHRREPRIELYGVKPHHDRSYMVPLFDHKDIRRWRKDLAEEYPDLPMRKDQIEDGCYKNGVLFDQRKLKDRVWDYDEVKTLINECFLNLIRAADGCFRIFRLRKPFKTTS